ncbi:MAG: polysaccharide pyruvyl transferase family protein [Gammaproteobacteria bacterium]|nr:polysaccharide pyruvyl transferase family protein [Gammaproteobacteria bacterium]
MKLVLAGGYDTQNLGDHAMLQVLRSELQARGVEPEITLLSRHPDEEFDALYGVTSIPNLDHPSRDAARGRVFCGLNGEVDPVALKRITNVISEADALVIGGGRMLVDYTHGFLRGHLAYFSLLVTLARCHGTKVVLYAQSLEELASDSGREHLKMIVRNADQTSVREEPSLEVLRGLDPTLVGSQVKIVPDPAFGLPWVAPYTGPKLPALHSNTPVLAANLRSYAWRDGDVREFEHRVAQWLDEVRSARPMQLLFLPQMTYDVDSGETDDRVVARRVVALMKDRSDVHCIEDRLTVDEALGMYHHADALLSMRRHGTLFAATQGVPVLPLSCETNTDYMSASLGLDAWRVDLEGMASGEACRRVLSVIETSADSGRAVRARVLEQAPLVGAYADAILSAIAAETLCEELIA